MLEIFLPGRRSLDVRKNKEMSEFRMTQKNGFKSDEKKVIHYLQ